MRTSNSMLKSTTFTLSFLIGVSLTGCFGGGSDSANKASSSITSQISSGAFSGATQATNMITGVKVSWDASTVTPSSYRVYRVNGTKLTLLTALSSEVTSFVDGSVTWGTIYTYIVRAVDLNGVEDANMKKVSSLAWAGALSVQSLNRNAIQVDFTSIAAAVDEIRIYLQPAAGGARVLAATASGSDMSATISGLHSGYSYNVSVQAYVSSLKKEDGNTAIFTVTTNTQGYHDDDSSTSRWLNITNVRAFGPSPGAGLHRDFPERTPRTNLVEISFRSFNGLSNSAQYAVTRAADGETLDTTVTTSCTNTTTTSCRVRCSSSATLLTGSGVLHCRDENAGGSPIRYRYTMSLVQTAGTESWTEPVPQDALDIYSVLVAMPPANMVLVQRDAANYEMCGQMNSAVDPKNHNRCPYTGVGAVPYNSGPGKPTLNFESGYYDFGYNLFVDRFEMACKWTRAVDGGMCGPGGTSGDCIAYNAQVAPDNSMGKNGDVFQRLGNGNEMACYYKFSDVWVAAGNIAVTAPNATEIYAKMYTSNPSDNGGKLGAARNGATLNSATLLCNANVDANYGPKRLPRLREYRVFTAQPTTSGDLYGKTYATAYSHYAAGAYNSVGGYRCPRASSFITSTDFTFPTSLEAMLDDSNKDFWGVYNSGVSYGIAAQLGSSITADCQGRYGLKDVITTDSSMLVSDTFFFNGVTMILTGTTALFDSGNRDLLQDTSGGQTGFVLNYSTASASGTSNRYFNLASTSVGSTVPYIALPLGLPILATSSSVYTPRGSFTEAFNSANYFPYSSTSVNIPLQVRPTARWTTNLNSAAATVIGSSYRCVMSAD